MAKYVYKKEIEEIFGYITDYHEYKETAAVYFTHSKNGVTFEQLQKLSKLLGTKMIDFEGRTERIEYSEWTSDTEYEGEISVSGVKFPRE